MYICNSINNNKSSFFYGSKQLNFDYIVQLDKNKDGSTTITTNDEEICVTNSLESICETLKENNLTT